MPHSVPIFPITPLLLHELHELQEPSLQPEPQFPVEQPPPPQAPEAQPPPQPPRVLWCKQPVDMTKRHANDPIHKQRFIAESFRASRHQCGEYG